MAQHIDPALLRAFVAVCDNGGMTSAGRQLHLTQAAVSQQIKRLEGQFQIEFFSRRQRKLVLTAEGERLLAYARRVLALNDEVWGAMTSPQIQGAVTLGVPYDIVGPFMPPILRDFSRAWPSVEVRLVCEGSQILLNKLRKGEIDIALTTERTAGVGGEILMVDRLVWVGAKDGTAHQLNPLPISLGSDTCTFQSSATAALAEVERDWRFICSTSDMSALCATIEADLAVAPLLLQTVPDGMVALSEEDGLPGLPDFSINLYMNRGSATDTAEELARYIRQDFALRYPQAA